ncbi:MAG: hypothetical protein ACRCZ0_01235 [Cetobacterium sp.]
MDNEQRTIETIKYKLEQNLPLTIGEKKFCIVRCGIKEIVEEETRYFVELMTVFEIEDCLWAIRWDKCKHDNGGGTDDYDYRRSPFKVERHEELVVSYRPIIGSGK